MKKPPPPAQTVFQWLRDNLGSQALAPLTGSDSRALQSAVQIVEQYAYDQHNHLILAFGLVVNRMLPHNQHLAYHAIAHVMDWTDRDRIWKAANCPKITNLSRCQFE